MNRTPILYLRRDVAEAIAKATQQPGRAHLVPKKVQVRRPSGVHQQTYYVKPGEEPPPQQRQGQAQPQPTEPQQTQRAAPQFTVKTNPRLDSDAPKQDYQGPFAPPTLEQCEAFVKEHEPALNGLLGDLERSAANVVPTANVKGRLKKAENLLVKIQQKRQKPGKEDYGLHKVTDVIGTRISMKSVGEMRRMEAHIQKNYKVLEHDDFAEDPREGDELGYRSIHFIVEKDGKPAEIQLRTPRQTRWADWCHDTLYKQHYLIEKLGQSMFNQVKPVMTEYAKKMSEYYAHIDQGKQPPEDLDPDCPTPLRMIRMCMEAESPDHMLPALLEYGHEPGPA